MVALVFLFKKINFCNSCLGLSISIGLSISNGLRLPSGLSGLPGVAKNIISADSFRSSPGSQADSQIFLGSQGSVVATMG